MIKKLLIITMLISTLNTFSQTAEIKKEPATNPTATNTKTSKTTSNALPKKRQTTFSKNGEIESNINYSAIVTITFTDMSDPQKVYINPLGLMITDFSQKEEML